MRNLRTNALRWTLRRSVNSLLSSKSAHLGLKPGSFSNRWNTVNLGQRVCWVPAVWPGNPACCSLRRPPLPEGTHLEGCGILALAPFIYWLEGEGDGKCALEKHRWVCEPATLCLTLDGLRECISQCGPGTSSISNSLGTCEKWTFSWGGWPQTDSIRNSGGGAQRSGF